LGSAADRDALLADCPIPSLSLLRNDSFSSRDTVDYYNGPKLINYIDPDTYTAIPATLKILKVSNITHAQA